ncbi:hypothetical protein BGX38DRAFT_1258029 [Terfezia claveryi]|nr:hypothetical protein BGX38DRAFT_1258029 [Terfezia claveryi]
MTRLSEMYCTRAIQESKSPMATVPHHSDSPQIWVQYSPKTKLHTARAGLFKNKHLTSPTGFSIYAQKTLAKAQRLVSKIISADTPEQLRRIVRDFDRLSDLLCRVIDMADFVRATHPKPEIVQAVNDAYGIMYEYMNVLNTTDGLYLALKKAIQNKDVVASLFWFIDGEVVFCCRWKKLMRCWV